MNRIFQWLNLLGVLIVAALCCLQWSANQRLADKVNALDQTRRQQSATLATQTQHLKDAADDLTDARQRLDISESVCHADEAKLTALQAERDQLAAETGQLKKSLAAWQSACALRDADIKKANATITDLNARPAAAVTKYNDLVAKYNATTREGK